MIGFNRYAYVNNNPINNTDPRGHCAEDNEPGPGKSQADHDRLCALKAFALDLSENVDSGEITDLEALARYVEFAAPFYEKTIAVYNGSGGFTDSPSNYYTYTDYDYQLFAEDIGLVLGGINWNGLMRGGIRLFSEDVRGRGFATWATDSFAQRIRITAPVDDSGTLDQYYVGQYTFSDTGFASDYVYEEASNQVLHFAGGLFSDAFGFIGRFGARWYETKGSPDDLLYDRSFELFGSNIPLDQWGGWIRQNVGIPHLAY